MLELAPRQNSPADLSIAGLHAKDIAMNSQFCPVFDHLPGPRNQTLGRRFSSFAQLAFCCFSLIFMVSTATWAQTEIDRQVDAEPKSRISIESFAGSLVIRGWQKKMVKVTGTLGRDVDELRLEKQGRDVDIEVEFDKRRHPSRISAHLEIQVPMGSQVEVETVSAEVDFDGIEGELEAETVSGDLAVEGAPRSVSFVTVSGEVEIVASTRLSKVETVSGDVKLVGVGGDVEVTTVSGDVDVLSEQIRQLQAELVSGDFEYQGTPAAGSDMEIASHSGDVVLSLPESSSASFKVQTFSGSIRNDLGPPAKKIDRYTPGKELIFELGAGEAQISIESFSGTVMLRSRD